MPTLRSEYVEKSVFWVLLAALMVGFFWLFSPFFSAIIFSLVLALAFDPIFEGFRKIFRNRRHLSAALTIFLILIFIGGPLGIIASLITTQLLKVAHTTQLNPHFLSNLLGSGFVNGLIQQVKDLLGIEIDLVHWLKEVLENFAQYLYQFSPKAVIRTANFLLTSVITIVLTYFLLVDGHKLYREILDISPLRQVHAETLSKEIRLTLRACIYGYILTALVQGILAAIGFTIVGIKISILLGVATFILSFIPFIGACGVWIPVLIYLLIQESYGYSLFMLIYGALVISGIDNILKPILIQEKTKIHPALLFLAIFGGLKLWGPIGILAGPTLVAVFLATLKIYRQDFR